MEIGKDYYLSLVDVVSAAKYVVKGKGTLAYLHNAIEASEEEYKNYMREIDYKHSLEEAEQVINNPINIIYKDAHNLAEREAQVESLPPKD